MEKAKFQVPDWSAGQFLSEDGQRAAALRDGGAGICGRRRPWSRCAPVALRPEAVVARVDDGRVHLLHFVRVVDRVEESGLKFSVSTSAHCSMQDHVLDAGLRGRASASACPVKRLDVEWNCGRSTWGWQAAGWG